MDDQQKAFSVISDKIMRSLRDDQHGKRTPHQIKRKWWTRRRVESNAGVFHAPPPDTSKGIELGKYQSSEYKIISSRE